MSDADSRSLGLEQCIQLNAPFPHPGKGNTLQRWRSLAAIAAQDLSICKLVEAHWDAVAILHDLGLSDWVGEGRRWAVWAAENPKMPLHLLLDQGTAHLKGSKAWCSGADVVTHALLTCTDEKAGSHFCLLDLQAPGMQADYSRWQPLGMRQVHTAELHFDQTPVQLLGPRSMYLERPGFWHGGAGIAACWYGAACAIAQKLCLQLATSNPHAAAHLGAMFAQLRAVRAMLHGLAARIDSQPGQPWIEEVLALRSMMRNVAVSVMEHSARALGSGPLCTDAMHAQRCADLAVWITQQHAERDDETLGKRCHENHIHWEL